MSPFLCQRCGAPLPAALSPPRYVCIQCGLEQRIGADAQQPAPFPQPAPYPQSPPMFAPPPPTSSGAGVGCVIAVVVLVLFVLVGMGLAGVLVLTRGRAVTSVGGSDGGPGVV